MKVLLDWEDETIASASYNNCIEKEGEYYINEKSHTPVKWSRLLFYKDTL